MVFSNTVIPVLVAIAVSACCITAQAPSKCSAAQAAVKQQFCKDCRTAVKCTSEAAPVTVTTCNAGTACLLFSIIPGTSVAGCTTISTSPCKCSSAKICDPYDPLKSWRCVGGALLPSTTCVAPQACSAGSCAIITPSLITGVCGLDDESKFIYMNQTCTSIGYCTGPGTPYTIINCAAGEYGNTNDGSCITAPPQPCADCVGACPDKTNCSQWNICGSTEPALIAQQQCPAKEFFDATAGTCGTDAKKCSIETACNFGNTITESTIRTPVTTSTISTTLRKSTNMPTSCTAANVGKSYGYIGECKKYMGCRLLINTYKYVESTCLGSLVFNPITSYCDLPANVPSCTTAG